MLSNTPAKILLVTDEAAIVAAVRGALQSTDLRADLRDVGSLSAYHKAVAAGAPDLVLLDLHLPGGGVETVLTSPPESGVFPILVLANQDAETLALAALESGALDYLVKSAESLASLPHSVRRALREWNLLLDRQRAEEAIRASEQHFRDFFEMGLIGMAITSPEKGWLQFNNELCRILGYSRDELARLTWSEITHPDDLAADVMKFDQVLARGIDGYTMEKRFVRKDGMIVRTSLSARCVRSVDGSVDHFLALVQDITQHKHVEDALRQSERRLRLLVEGLPLGAVYIEGDTLWLNASAERITGYTNAEVTTVEEWFHLLYRAEAARFREFYEAERAAGFPAPCVVCLRRKDDQTRWVEFSAYRQQNAEIWLLHDVTDRQRAEASLQESERRYRTLFEQSPISIWEEDFSAVQEYFTELRAQGVTDWAVHFAAHPEDVAECAHRVRILNVNAAALKLFEAHDKAELLINLPNYFVAESYPAFREQMTAIATGRTEIAMEIPIRDLHGVGRTVSLFLSILPGHEQTLDRVIVSFIDITESKQAEATLRASEQRFRLMADMMPVGVILSRLPDYTVQYVNPKAAEMFGGAQAQAAGRRTEDFYVNPADAAPVRRALEQSGVMESDEVLLRRVNGEQFWGLISGTVITDRVERIALAAVRDITERKQTEERLQASLREKNTLLKEVHHRVKNNLQIVCSLLNLQTEGLQSEAAVAALHDTQNRVRAMALLHETLYQAGNLGQVKFAWYVDNLCAHLGRLLGLGDGRIQLELRVADVALPMEHAVPLGLIINELLSNAVKHAFPDGRAGRIVLELLQATDHQLLLRVADDGVGLRSDFDVRQSRSLGLRLIFGLAEQLGGQAELKRAGGTVFQLTFPGAAHEA
ncbi:MAG: PAS domain S-box protein [Planctomycetota bacterium]|nr:PAS domain S-box protein [Planctomycetota bacterium]